MAFSNRRFVPQSIGVGALSAGWYNLAARGAAERQERERQEREREEREEREAVAAAAVVAVVTPRPVFQGTRSRSRSPNGWPAGSQGGAGKSGGAAPHGRNDGSWQKERREARLVQVETGTSRDE